MKDTRKTFLFYLLPIGLVVFLIVVAGAALHIIQKAEDHKPNVLFVLIDTLRRDHLGCYGYPRATSPNIDRLASEGVLFNNAVSQSSWTLPSMISMMMGRYVFADISSLPEGTKCMAESFKERGYQTAAFVGSKLVGREEGFPRGFDHFKVDQEVIPEEMRGRPELKPWAGEIFTKQVMDWARENLKEPYLLYLHYIDPHAPYVPQEEYTVFREDYDPIGDVRIKRYLEYMEGKPELKESAERDIAEMRRLIDLYDGEVKYADKCFGDLQEGLRSLGLMDNTVVVLTSDHGEGLWDHPHYPNYVKAAVPMEERDLTTHFWNGHGLYLFEELINVPLIIKGPGLLKNRRVDTAVENVDLMPTLLALCGERSPFEGDGQNLHRVLTDPAFSLSERDLLFSFCSQVTCVIHPERKLKLLRPNKTGALLGLDVTLFDLSEDPGEQRNYLLDGEEIHKESARRLREVIERREKEDPLSKYKGEYGEATKEKMRALGYIK